MDLFPSMNVLDDHADGVVAKGFHIGHYEVVGSRPGKHHTSEPEEPFRVVIFFACNVS